MTAGDLLRTAALFEARMVQYLPLMPAAAACLQLLPGLPQAVSWLMSRPASLVTGFESCPVHAGPGVGAQRADSCRPLLVQCNMCKHNHSTYQSESVSFQTAIESCSGFDFGTDAGRCSRFYSSVPTWHAAGQYQQQLPDH